MDHVHGIRCFLQPHDLQFTTNASLQERTLKARQTLLHALAVAAHVCTQTAVYMMMATSARVGFVGWGE